MDPSGGFDQFAFVPEFYDYVVPYRERPDVGFFVEASKESGGPVLELGCGTGRVLLPTAQQGIDIVGLDASSNMLALCREKLAEEPPAVQSRVTLVQSDMRSFSLRREFALVTLPFRPFQHLLTVADQLSCLASIRRHLRKGGRVILDVFNPSLPHLVEERYLQEFGEEPEFRMPDGRRILRRHRCLSRDLSNQILTLELVHDVTHPDGRKEQLVARILFRYLFRFEAEHLLVRAGFKVEQVYGDYQKSPFGEKWPGELILLARKA